MPTWQFDNFKEAREEHGPLLSGVVDHLRLNGIGFLSWTQIWTLVWFEKNRQKPQLKAIIDSFLCAALWWDWPEHERCWPFAPIWPLTWLPAESCWCSPERLPSHVLGCCLSHAGHINVSQRAERNHPPVEREMWKKRCKFKSDSIAGRRLSSNCKPTFSLWYSPNFRPWMICL